MMKDLNIIGINAFHGDSSACLVSNGVLINAIEEERINRVKHWAGLPIESIRWCLTNANLKIDNIDYIAISRDPSVHFHKKILRLLKKPPSINFIRNRSSNLIKVKDLKKEIAAGLNLKSDLIKAKIENIEHHKAHIASSFYVSGFNESACLTVDGFGDFVSTMRASGKDSFISTVDYVEFPHSLGIFYTAITQFLGFPFYGDEYKVMGMSAYGKPIYLDKMRNLVKVKNNGLFELDTSYFLHDKDGVEMTWNNGSPHFGNLFSEKLLDLFGNPRLKGEEVTTHHKDLAASAQALYEEVFFHIVNDTYKKINSENLSLAGGCIQNSLANGKIYKNTPYKKVYIPPAAYDAGTAIGAAFETFYKYSKEKKSYIMNSPYLGPDFSDTNIEDIIKSFENKLKEKNCKVEKMENQDSLCIKIAEYIANGAIVGWFQGRTEFGPRALGNRSILADPRSKEMKTILNERVKRRESFRPFAPSILEEKVSEWFEEDHAVTFMEKVYKIKEEKRSLIPAVCHEDGTGRLQTVSSETNEKYYSLIKEFEKITNIPMLLNTSFNDNEPIVNIPAQAINCFLNTKMDLLILNNYIIDKTPILGAKNLFTNLT